MVGPTGIICGSAFIWNKRARADANFVGPSLHRVMQQRGIAVAERLRLSPSHPLSGAKTLPDRTVHWTRFFVRMIMPRQAEQGRFTQIFAWGSTFLSCRRLLQAAALVVAAVNATLERCEQVERGPVEKNGGSRKKTGENSRTS
jgi:hypothetical protein